MSSLLPGVLAAPSTRALWLGAWSDLFARETAGRARLTPEELSAVFGRELEHLSSLGDGATEEVADAVLRSTANCLAQRGVALPDVLVAISLAERAAGAVLGALGETLAALRALESARVRVYGHVYLARGEAPARGCAVGLPQRLGSASSRTGPPDARGMVGKSQALRRVLDLVESAARGARTLLITGESGTGKELVARAIHAAASRDHEPFVAVNCAALSPSLVESELFGHVRGAFTGSGSEHQGLFRAASGGTLLLDEVSEMGAEVQAKLLRALEEHAVRPVGSVREVPVDIRVLASSNRDLPRAIAEGRFRADLFYRLQAFTIPVPPLRQRREDIPLLVDHFLGSFCSRRCGCILGVTPETLQALQAYDWPGNVRELRNVIEHAVTSGAAPWVGLQDLPAHIADLQPAGGRPASCVPNLPRLADAEAQLVRMAIDQCGGNKLAAARALGISRHKLYETLRRATRGAA